MVETKYPASNHKTRTEIKINIVDVNDNAPEILQQPINIFIPRNGKIGTAVKQVYTFIANIRKVCLFTLASIYYGDHHKIEMFFAISNKH